MTLLIFIFTSFPKRAASHDAAQRANHSEEDPEKLAAQRKRFDDEMEAFQQMMNYNADVAYGIVNLKEK